MGIISYFTCLSTLPMPGEENYTYLPGGIQKYAIYCTRKHCDPEKF